MAEVRWHVVFSGRVQHVGFRYTAYYLAREYHLSGWVDNLPDGRVEMEIQGGVTQIRRFLLRLKAKPNLSIAGMEISKTEPKPFERKFCVRGYE